MILLVASGFIVYDSINHSKKCKNCKSLDFRLVSIDLEKNLAKSFYVISYRAVQKERFWVLQIGNVLDKSFDLILESFIKMVTAVSASTELLTYFNISIQLMDHLTCHFNINVICLIHK